MSLTDAILIISSFTVSSSARTLLEGKLSIVDYAQNDVVISTQLHITPNRSNIKSGHLQFSTQKWPPTLELIPFVLTYIHLAAAVTVAICISNDLASLSLAMKKI